MTASALQNFRRTVDSRLSKSPVQPAIQQTNVIPAKYLSFEQYWQKELPALTVF